MGADLYIRAITDPAREKYQPLMKKAAARQDTATSPVEKEEIQEEVTKYYELMYPPEGYFRDSYNSTNMLNRLGLSWWVDIIPLLNKQGNLSPRRAKALADRIEKLPLQMVTEKWLQAHGAHVDETETVDSWNEYYAEKRRRFVAFLRHAVELNQPIYCSL